MGIVAILTLLACQAPPAARAAAFSQNLSVQAKSPIEECVRLAKESMTLRGQGKLAEAITATQAMIAIERKVLAADDPNLAVSLGWLAQLNLENNDFAAATAGRQAALLIVQKRFGEAHWETTDARLALDNVKLQASLTGEQRERLAQASRLNQAFLALYDQGKYAEAAESARREVAIRKDVLGERNRDYATSLNNLAYALRTQGDNAAARPLCEQALAIRKVVLGERHPAYADSLSGLAALLDYAAARPLYERALAIRKEALGERHPDYALSLNNLATMFHSHGNYAAARPLYERALAIRKEVLGERHADYSMTLNDLAGLLDAQGDYAAAGAL
jgi:tetratricopeptide (TPR) repeat protein